MGATEDIRRAIELAGGAISFGDFMELALYGRHGFYIGAPAGQAGRRGDFLTAPEVGPLFGAVVARFLDAEYARLDRPDAFTVVDAGAGPGALARAVLTARPSCLPALRYVAVERSSVQRAQHPPGIDSRADLPPGPIDGVVIANELLDNLPFRLAVFDGRWREAYVAEGGGGRLVEVLQALDEVQAVLPPHPPHGARAPLQDRAGAWLAQARSMLRRGRVVVIDYARPTTAEMAERSWREWLRTYRGHRRGDHYLAAPGEQDITADVALDQLRPEPEVVSTLAEFLRQWGIDELVAEGREEWERAAAAPDLAALAMRSRVREAEALLDPAGLGAFVVAEWAVSPLVSGEPTQFDGNC